MRIKNFLEKISFLSPNTLKSYNSTLKALKKVCKGDIPSLEEIKSFLEKFRNSPSTYRRHLSAIKKYLEFEGIPLPSDFPGKIPPLEEKEPQYLMRSDIQKLILTAKDPEVSLFIRIQFEMGLRIGEVMSIVKESITKEGIWVKTKGGKTVLKIAPSYLLAELLDISKNLSPGERLFKKSREYYRRALKILCREIGVEEITPHKLRHSRAVDLIERGVDLPTVQKVLGHKRITTTGIYTLITKDHLRKKMERLSLRKIGKEELYVIVFPHFEDPRDEFDFVSHYEEILKYLESGALEIHKEEIPEGIFDEELKRIIPEDTKYSEVIYSVISYLLRRHKLSKDRIKISIEEGRYRNIYVRILDTMNFILICIGNTSVSDIIQQLKLGVNEIWFTSKEGKIAFRIEKRRLMSPQDEWITRQRIYGEMETPKAETISKVEKRTTKRPIGEIRRPEWKRIEDWIEMKSAKIIEKRGKVF